MNREEILEKAKKTVISEKIDQYGNPEDSFGIIAKLFEIYIKNKCLCIENNLPSVKISAYDTAVLMSLLKIGRLAGGNGSLDTWIDLAGYAACGGEIFSSSNIINKDISKEEIQIKEPEITYFSNQDNNCDNVVISFFADDIFSYLYDYPNDTQINDLISKYCKIPNIYFSIIFNENDDENFKKTKEKYIQRALVKELSKEKYIKDSNDSHANWIVISFDPLNFVKLDRATNNSNKKKIFITLHPEYFSVDSSICMVNNLSAANNIIDEYLKEIRTTNRKDDETKIE